MGKVHQKPGRRFGPDGIGEDKGVCVLYTHVEKQAMFINVHSDGRCNCKLEETKVAGGKNEIYCCYQDKPIRPS